MPKFSEETDCAGNASGLESFYYDQPGRLTGGSYLDDSSEQDAYDGAGSRAVITSTGLLASEPVTSTANPAEDSGTPGGDTTTAAAPLISDADRHQ